LAFSGQEVLLGPAAVGLLAEPPEALGEQLA